MQRNKLNVEVRATEGTRSARRMRREGKIPAILYGKGTEALNITLDVKELRKVLSGKGGHNTLLELQGSQVGGKLAMVKAMQHDAVSDVPTHADLLELKLDHKITVHVPIHLVGKAKGTVEGGIVASAMREISVECLPNDIPESVDVDITELNIGDSLHVRDIKLPANVKAVGDVGASVVGVVPPAAEVVAAPVVSTEPEVLTAKGEKAPEGAAGAKAAPAAGGKAAPAAKK
jgi:large subunit ribosomal protein L25